MKNLFPTKVLASVLIIACLFAGGCASTKKSVPSFVGSWDYMVYDTPEGDVSGVFIIDQLDDGYKGKFKIRGMNLDMKDLKIEDNKVSCYITIQEYKVDFIGEFNENTFSGTGALDYNKFKIEAVKAK